MGSSGSFKIKGDLLLISIIIVVLISSTLYYSSSDAIGLTPIDEIAKNERLFNGEVVSVMGTMGEEVLIDDQGFKINISLTDQDIRARIIYPGGIYKAQGLFKVIDVCVCQERKVDTKGQETWININPDDVKSRCDTSSSRFRCKPGTEGEKYSFLDVQEPVKKIKGPEEL